jgi:hypothetical protein
MFELLWWHWALIGFGFMLSELLIPTFVLVWFGLGGLLVMLSLLALPDMGLPAQILIWICASLVLTFLWFKVFKRGDHKITVGRASAHIEGEVGLLIEPVEPFKNGRVRFQKPILGSDAWECRAESALPAGARVKIVRVEGSLVLVAPAAQGENT